MLFQYFCFHYRSQHHFLVCSFMDFYVKTAYRHLTEFYKYYTFYLCDLAVIKPQNFCTWALKYTVHSIGSNPRPRFCNGSGLVLT